MRAEGKGGIDSKPLHHHAADAIGEAPGFVSRGGKDLPRLLHIGRRDSFHLAHLAVQHSLSDIEGAVVFTSYPEQRQQLVNHVNRRNA
jgi:hypothetical protein